MTKIRESDRLVASIATRQHGHVTRAQLLAAGLTSAQVGTRIRRMTLIPVHAGVYAVGYVPVDPVSRAAAAVLACGRSGALSHGSAAALWGMVARWEMPVEVTVACDRRRPGIRIHRTTTLARRDVTMHFGVRVTSPARTLLDVAPRLSTRRLPRVYNDALLSNYLRPAALRELLGRCPSHPGACLLAPLLSTVGGPTRSDLEDAFLAFVDRFGLPRPQVNVHVGGYLVDAYYPDHDLIVELDSVTFHSNREAFERDRERDADALACGRRTLRITHERLQGRPEHEAARLRRILASRRPPTRA